MTRSSEPEFAEALQAVIKALDELDSPSMVIGGVAVIALGVPRYTADIDVTIQGRSSHPEQVFSVFSHHEIAGASPGFDRPHDRLLLLVDGAGGARPPD
ncbi:MAG TPA: hypothetical protein VIA62_13280 [Thermoanaerobaculia bacterium]|nr:hypothetical protein [Thermoanaerobaculia bacterium]